MIQELLVKLAKTQNELNEVKLDLISETEARRKWQEELKELKEHKEEKVSSNSNVKELSYLFLLRIVTSTPLF